MRTTPLSRARDAAATRRSSVKIGSAVALVVLCGALVPVGRSSTVAYGVMAPILSDIRQSSPRTVVASQRPTATHDVVQRKAAPSPVHVWMTTADGANRISPQAELHFSRGGAYTPLSINVNDSQTYQQVEGFGASLTDTSAWLLYNRLDVATRQAVMRDLFDPVEGVGLSFLRQPVGASDFTHDSVPYSLDDVKSGALDPTLASFSLAHDAAYIVPALHEALHLNPTLKVLATPWSPPPWMKMNGLFNGSYSAPLTLSSYAPLADYIVRFIQGYQQRGIPIYAITLQNEPNFATRDYPGMFFPTPQALRYLTLYLAPALHAAGLHPHVLAYDDRWGAGRFTDRYPWRMLGDRAAGQMLAGTSYHCYYGSPDVMSELHADYPHKDIYETECSGGKIAPGPVSELAINAMRNWSRTVILWNVAVDTHNGPREGSGCTKCLGLVTVDQAHGSVSYTNDYYQLGQMSRFVVPGAYRVASNSFGDGTYGSETLADVAFRDPNGTKVLVVYNGSSSRQTFRVQWGSIGFTESLPSRATATFTWTGTRPQDPAGLAAVPRPVDYAIDAAGPGEGGFMADSFASAGRNVSTKAAVTTRGADQPALEALYQSMRLGPLGFTYTFPDLVPGDHYRVRLHFAEIVLQYTGQRLFDVVIQGRRVLHDYDIVREAGGPNRAIVRTIRAVASRDGTLSVQFLPGRADWPAVSGIEIVRVRRPPGVSVPHGLSSLRVSPRGSVARG